MRFQNLSDNDICCLSVTVNVHIFAHNEPPIRCPSVFIKLRCLADGERKERFSNDLFFHENVDFVCDAEGRHSSELRCINDIQFSQPNTH